VAARDKGEFSEVKSRLMDTRFGAGVHRVVVLRKLNIAIPIGRGKLGCSIEMLLAAVLYENHYCFIKDR